MRNPNIIRGKHFVILLLLFLVMGATGLAANDYKSHFLEGLCVIMMGIFFWYAAWLPIRTGVEKSNWGTFYRDRNPFAFWFGVALWGAVALFLTGIGIAIMLHLVTPAGW
jgi:hypothetical protein